MVRNLTGNLIIYGISAPAGPEIKYNMGPKQNIIWGQSREYKRRPMLKILADHMMNHHMVAAAGSGGHHVAPHHVVR